MLTIRCTQRLLKVLGVKLSGEPSPASTTKLGDWYANVIGSARGNRVLCTNERSLLSVVLEPEPWAMLPGALAIALSVILGRAGVAHDVIFRELAEMEKGIYAKTNSRVVLGVMTDLAYATQLDIEDGLNEIEISERLAQTPCSPLGFAFPIEVAKALLLGGTAA